jgi:putative DNA primase/helicase
VEDAIARLAKLSKTDYELCRDEQAKRLKVRVSFLDEEVESRRPMTGNNAKDDSLVPECKPWPEKVNGEQLLKSIRSEIDNYVILPPVVADVVALWILHTYNLDVTNITPRLFAYSPDKGCGKTTLLSLLARLCYRAIAASNITAASVYRIIEQCELTLIIDEADTFLPGNERLRGVLNSGHRRDTAFILCCDGDDHTPRRFSSWCAMAVASIGTQHGTLMDRSIVVRMKRKSRTEHVSRLGEDSAAYHRQLSAQARRWSDDNCPQLQHANPKIPIHLQNREADNWLPLLAIADRAGGDWPKRARDAAELLSKTSEDEGSLAVRLLADIRAVFEAELTDKLSSKVLCDRLSDRDDRPWGEFSAGKPITPIPLARLLKGFGIAPRTQRNGNKFWKGYARSDFHDAWMRYLPPDRPVTPSQANNMNGFDAAEGVTPSDTEDGRPVTPSQTNSGNPAEVRDDVTGVGGAVPDDVTGLSADKPLTGNGCDDVTGQTAGDHPTMKGSSWLKDFLNTPTDYVFLSQTEQWVPRAELRKERVGDPPHGEKGWAETIR